MRPRVSVRDVHATDLIVEGADMQGCVPRGVLGAHVCAIEKQMFQVLDMAVPAGLRKRLSETLVPLLVSPETETPKVPCWSALGQRLQHPLLVSSETETQVVPAG